MQDWGCEGSPARVRGLFAVIAWCFLLCGNRLFLFKALSRLDIYIMECSQVWVRWTCSSPCWSPSSERPRCPTLLTFEVQMLGWIFSCSTVLANELRELRANQSLMKGLDVPRSTYLKDFGHINISFLKWWRLGAKSWAILEGMDIQCFLRWEWSSCTFKNKQESLHGFGGGQGAYFF